MRVEYRTDLVPDDAFAEIAEPGEPGRDGADGRDGVGHDGRDGADGRDAVGWTYRGEWRHGRQYVAYDVVSHEGSSYLCVADTKSEPPSKAWGTLAERGERGEQGEAGQRGRAVTVATDGVKTKAFYDSAVVRGNALYASGANHVDLASAAPGDASAASVVGLASAAIGPGGYGEYATSGPFVCDAWNWTPGLMVYLSPDSPGGLSQTYPTGPGEYVVLIGQALAPTAIALNIHYLLVQP